MDCRTSALGRQEVFASETEAKTAKIKRFKWGKRTFKRTFGCRFAGNASTEELMAVFMRKQGRFAERIRKYGLPEPPKSKIKKTEEEKSSIKRAVRKRRKKRKAELERQVHDVPEQDDNFFIRQFIR